LIYSSTNERQAREDRADYGPLANRITFR
jgi:hypothetical protein